MAPRGKISHGYLLRYLTFSAWQFEPKEDFVNRINYFIAVLKESVLLT